MMPYYFFFDFGSLSIAEQFQLLSGASAAFHSIQGPSARLIRLGGPSVKLRRLG